MPQPPLLLARRKPAGRGFTLVELLAVIAIIAVLLAIVTPAFVGAVRSNNLTNSVSIVMDQLANARQTAISRNRLVEVRFYQLKDPGTGQSGFRGLKTLLYAASGTSQPLTRLYQLNSPVSISTYTDNNGTQSPALRVVAAQTETLPGQTGAIPYCKIVFSPSGRTDLGPPPATLPWYLTLYTTNAPITDTANHLPANWAVLQIDDYTGRVRVFRP